MAMTMSSTMCSARAAAESGCLGGARCNGCVAWPWGRRQQQQQQQQQVKSSECRSEQREKRLQGRRWLHSRSRSHGHERGQEEEEEDECRSSSSTSSTRASISSSSSASPAAHKLIEAQQTTTTTATAADSPRSQRLRAPAVHASSLTSRWCTAKSASSAIGPILSHPAANAAAATSASAHGNEDLSSSLGRHFYLNKALESYAGRPSTRITLRQLVFFGRRVLHESRDAPAAAVTVGARAHESQSMEESKIIRSANYVRQELPIRLAHRIRDLQALPFVVMTNKHLGQVYNKYWHAFETLRRFPAIRTMQDNEAFCSTLKAALTDHLTIIPSLTLGIVEESDHLSAQRLDRFMERMLRSRIARRVLAEQHIALSEALDDPFHFFDSPSQASLPAAADGEHVGIIYTSLCVSDVVRKGIKLLRDMFARETGRSASDEWIPIVALDGDLEARFAYIPEHLEYIIFELLKNAMSAVMKRPMEERDEIPIRVTIVEGPPDEDLIVRISDCGGGLPDLVESLASHDALQSWRPLLPGNVAPKASAHAHPILAAAAEGREMPPASDDELPAGSLDATAAAPRRAYPEPAAHTKKADVTSGDRALIDVLTSFSSVRKRLELEHVLKDRRGEQRKLAPPGLAVSEGYRITDTGLGSRQRLEALKSTKEFKGTVAEQMANASGRSGLASDAPAALQQPAWLPRGDDGTSAHVMRKETGLGLPMTRIYTEFLGGRLTLRSVDGGGLDVYLRLQKLGDKQEQIDDIEL